MNVKSIKNRINWCRKNPIKTIIIVVLLILIGLLIANLSGEHCRPYFIKNLGITETSQCCSPGTLIVRLGYAIGGVIASLVAVASFERVRALDKTADAQEQGNIEDRYKNAIIQFGNTNSSVRLAGAYGLYHLAIDNEDRRRNICDVLCVHIRELTTSEVAVGKNSDGKEIKYSEKYATKPSNEIQSILDLLVNKENKKDFPFKSHWINLASAYLNGANLVQAQLQGADLSDAQLQRASLYQAQLQGAILDIAQLQGANLREAQLQVAYLSYAQLQNAEIKYAQFQGANLRDAQLQGSILSMSQFQGADLSHAHLQGTTLDSANFQGASLYFIEFQGANLYQAQFQGVVLWHTHIQGANLSFAQFQGADLREIDFRGTYSKNSKAISIDAGIERLKARRNQKDDIKNAIFSGGVTTEQLENFKQNTAETLKKLKKIKNYDQDKINHFKQEMNRVEKILEENIDKPIDSSIPSEAITGVYPKAEADKIIAMLEKIKNELAET